MTEREKAVVAACADTTFPATGPIPVSGTEAGSVEYFEKYLGRLVPSKRFLIRLLILFIQFGPWLFGPRRARFTHLTQDERARYFQEMSVSVIYFRRVAFMAMRIILTFGYFQCPNVADRIMHKEARRETT
jgi:hypothetical protein